MKTIACPGYEGHKCEMVIKKTGRNHKRCSGCAAKAHLMNTKTWNKANPENRRVADKKWRKANLAACRTRERLYEKSNLDRRRESKWRSRGITTDDGATLTYKRFRQDVKKGCMFKGLGACSGKLGADHNHETGFYRGPLCHAHNTGLGKLGDSPESLRRAANILENKA